MGYASLRCRVGLWYCRTGVLRRGVLMGMEREFAFRINLPEQTVQNISADGAWRSPKKW